MIDYFFFFVGNACVLALLLGVFRGYFNRVWACIFWVGLAALHADGYHAEATEINRQVHAQREAAIRNLWVHGAPQERKAAEASKIDEFMRVIFGR